MKQYFKNFFTGLAILVVMVLVLGIIIGLPVWIMLTMDSLTGGIIGVSIMLIGWIALGAFFIGDESGYNIYLPPSPPRRK